LVVSAYKCRSLDARSSAPVELTTRYTTADIVLEVGRTSASVE